MNGDGSAAQGGPEKHLFQAEVAELLNLMIHSVYSETDVFLRELVSNASDACDKVRYEAIARPELLAGDERLAIRIKPDAAAKTLTIADNGIGMDRQELIDNLGTLARSGTRAFLKGLKDAKDGLGLIGQFGVGFYAAFMVADRIEVTSRRAGAGEAWTWTSASGAGFEVSPAASEQAARVPRGTEIVLHLKEDAVRYLQPYELERIVRTYSDHVLFPIELIDDKGEARQVNAASALWQRPKSEVKPEDYTQAYRSLAMAFDEPALTLHYKVEGRQSYAVLLFVPSTPPFDLTDPARKGRVKLYVRRVYITDDAELLPAYLRFVRGLVDSEDLPLNLSREMLQNNPQVRQIRSGLVGRVLSELESTATKDAEAYGKIWETFGPILKEGLYEDHERRAQLLGLARFASTAGDTPRSIKQYVADLKPNQTEIYYLVGDSLDRLKSNPKLEAAKARGVEVLLLTDPVDAFWTTLPQEFDGKPLKSLSQGEVDFGLIPLVEEEKAKDAATDAGDDAAVLEAAKQVLGDKVADVKASTRLTDSASCLVASAQGRDRELERLLERQNRGSGAKPILELNMKHAMVKALGAAKKEDRAQDVDDLANLLLDEACILDGEIPSDPAAFARRLNDYVVRALRGSATV
ncbi:MAG: molecular chaperone HtpG [Reyranella sp.]|uniref:molecular chaperone HtpG n=1 Tax=Reyranella sp. TaxID=1929291 RepID=UPI0011F41589|nr:molecular chaperone HtpG [Reyranella sp.]TAJ97975.1 MAG: molecular chaperone HtpG [Reyranella sp.]TBR30087.1 MAG: molecular chaperone HtpG [Reyranella sp.]